jgi:hypothetical protein
MDDNGFDDGACAGRSMFEMTITLLHALALQRNCFGVETVCGQLCAEHGVKELAKMRAAASH